MNYNRENPEQQQETTDRLEWVRKALCDGPTFTEELMIGMHFGIAFGRDPEGDPILVLHDGNGVPYSFTEAQEVWRLLENGYFNMEVLGD